MAKCQFGSWLGGMLDNGGRIFRSEVTLELRKRLLDFLDGLP